MLTNVYLLKEGRALTSDEQGPRPIRRGLRAEQGPTSGQLGEQRRLEAEAAERVEIEAEARKGWLVRRPLVR